VRQKNIRIQGMSVIKKCPTRSQLQDHSECPQILLRRQTDPHVFKSSRKRQYRRVGVIHNGQREVLITASTIHLKTSINWVSKKLSTTEIIPVAKYMATHGGRYIIARVRFAGTAMQRVGG
jgi:hypothetical protein